MAVAQVGHECELMNEAWGVEGASHASCLDHSLAATSSGEVLAWGNNGQGQLGNAHSDDNSLPIETLCLGDAGGRTYTVSLVATDECMNASTTLAGRIRVPHDQSSHERGSTPIDTEQATLRWFIKTRAARLEHPLDGLARKHLYHSRETDPCSLIRHVLQSFVPP